MGPGNGGVDALRQCRVELPGQAAQTARVRLGEVGEPGGHVLRQWPGERGTAGQVDVIADQYRLPDRVARIDAARRVGEHDGPAASRDGGAHPVHHSVRVVPFVKMNSPEVQQDAELALSYISNGRCVTLYGRLLKSPQVGNGNFGFGRPDRVGGGEPAGAQTTTASKPSAPARLFSVAALAAARAKGSAAAGVGRCRYVVHGADHLVVWRPCHVADYSPCYCPVIRVTEW